MPRSSRSRASAPPSRAPMRASPPPARQPTPAAQPPATQPAPGGRSLMGGIMETVGQGLAFGTGSAIAHRAVDSIMGPRTVVHEHVGETPAAAPAVPAAGISTQADACASLQHQFVQCVEANGSDISRCQVYVDMLSDCKRQVQA